MRAGPELGQLVKASMEAAGLKPSHAAKMDKALRSRLKLSHDGEVTITGRDGRPDFVVTDDGTVRDLNIRDVVDDLVIIHPEAFGRDEPAKSLQNNNDLGARLAALRSQPWQRGFSR